MGCAFQLARRRRGKGPFRRGRAPGWFEKGCRSSRKCRGVGVSWLRGVVRAGVVFRRHCARFRVVGLAALAPFSDVPALVDGATTNLCIVGAELADLRTWRRNFAKPSSGALHALVDFLVHGIGASCANKPAVRALQVKRSGNDVWHGISQWFGWGQ